MSERAAVVLLTRDLRMHDHPALATACAAFDRVVPLYVLDPALADRSPNRTRFLHQSLAELRAALRERDGDLVVRHGDPVAETIRRIDVGRLPDPPDGESPDAATGGESVGQRRLTQWLPTLDRYDDIHDDMAGDETSGLSPYLRWGCLSPLAVANRAGDRAGPFVRQLCWRDFYYQVTAAFPEISTKAYRRGATEGYPPPLEVPGADPVWMR